MKSNFTLNTKLIREKLEEFDLNIKELRDRLAEYMSDPPDVASVRKWLNEEKPSVPRIDAALILARVLGIQPEELLYDPRINKVADLSTIEPTVRVEAK